MPQPTPETELIEQMLSRMRAMFYSPGHAGSKQFYQQRSLLVEAVTYPARWLHQRGIWLTQSRYRSILYDILRDIKHHGDLARIKHWGIYILHCVQQHMLRHGDHYYEQGKTLRDHCDEVLDDLRQRARRTPRHDATAATAAQHTIATLAAIHAAMRAARPRRKPRPRDSGQIDLL